MSFVADGQDVSLQDFADATGSLGDPSGGIIGETSGLYAGVSVNNNVDTSNPQSGVSLGSILSVVPSIVSGVTQTIGNVENAENIQAINQAKTAAAIAKVSTPSLATQFASATLMEKMAIGLGLFGFLYVVAHKGRI